MNFAQISDREKILIGIAILSAVIALYTVARYKPQQTDLKQMQAEVTRLKSRLKSVQLPRGGSENASALEKKIEKTQHELERKTARLEGLEQQFVDMNSADAVQGLMVEISNLAKTSGVIIRETLQYDGKSSPPQKGKPNLENVLIGGGVYRRPARKMQIEGSYRSIRQFFIGLNGLSKRVVILRFSLKIIPMADERKGIQQLESSLLVAL